VPPWGAPRLAALAVRGSRISAVADDEAQVERFEAAAREAGVVLHVVVDVDLGQHRSGCAPEAAPALARRISGSASLRFEGVQAYLGHLQHEADLELRSTGVAAATERLNNLVAELTEAGLPPNVVTGGGTGTHIHDLALGVFTELQAGSYAVMDVEYDACGAPDGGSWGFEPAMFIAASVVSAQHKTHCTTDAGLKAVSVDGPPARIVHGAPEGSAWRPMGDEHGAIFGRAFLTAWQSAGNRTEQAKLVDRIDGDPLIPWETDRPRTGDLIWLQPGHCDPTINLYDAFFVADEDGTLERWPIDARRITAALRRL
jgi:D-serine deaminase-like pyridoxal phosphate-dependent protein